MKIPTFYNKSFMTRIWYIFNVAPNTIGSWTSDGSSFVVFNNYKFIAYVELYFKKYKSTLRNLINYGVKNKRINGMTHIFHEKLHRDNFLLVYNMKTLYRHSNEIEDHQIKYKRIKKQHNKIKIKQSKICKQPKIRKQSKIKKNINNKTNTTDIIDTLIIHNKIFKELDDVKKKQKKNILYQIESPLNENIQSIVKQQTITPINQPAIPNLQKQLNLIKSNILYKPVPLIYLLERNPFTNTEINTIKTSETELYKSISDFCNTIQTPISQYNVVGDVYPEYYYNNNFHNPIEKQFNW